MPFASVHASREELAEDLRPRLSPRSVVRVGAMLGPRTTLGVGGPADLLVEPADEADLLVVLQFCAAGGVPWRVLGRGSNLLVRDGGVRGVVLVFSGEWFTRITVAENRLDCGAGARLKAVAGRARREGLAGLEFLDGIPGSVGGALRMNAGAHGSWVFEVLERVRCADASGRVAEVAAGDLAARYRGCPFFDQHLAMSAVLRGHPEDPEAIGRRMEALATQRRATQPREPSAGCIFKNPPEIPAGRLIDELGLKGTRIGGARVSEVHGNFIVNTGGATADHVLELIELIRGRAAERAIHLDPEVEIIGEDLPSS